MTKPAPIGSDAWIGADDYDAPRTKRIVDFMAAANEKALKSYASSLRNHQSCNISDKFSMGTTHLVRKLQFDDGVQWIARLRMPRLNGSTTNRKQDLSEMRCELDTVEFVWCVYNTGTRKIPSFSFQSIGNKVQLSQKNRYSNPQTPWTRSESPKCRRLSVLPNGLFKRQYSS